MEEFSKSRIGKKFLEFDIPRLTEAMEKLANAMVESNKLEEKKLLLEHKKFINEKNSSKEQ